MKFGVIVWFAIDCQTMQSKPAWKTDNDDSDNANATTAAADTVVEGSDDNDADTDDPVSYYETTEFCHPTKF